MDDVVTAALPRKATIALEARRGDNRAAFRLAASLRLLVSRPVLAMADQAMISALSFLTVVLVGNWAGLEELAVYAICGSIIALCLATQYSLITQPYTIHIHRSDQARAERAFGSLALSVVLAAAAGIVVVLAGEILSALKARGELLSVTYTLSWALPLVAMREFARRLEFAHFRIERALALDAFCVGVNSMGLVGLGLNGRLSAVSALALLGISCGLGVGGWLYLARDGFALSVGHIRSALRESLGMGKWLFSAQLAIQVQGYATPWLAMAIGGAAITGVYTACTSMLSFANPLLYGCFNVMAPKSAKAFSVEGGAGARRQAFRDTMVLGALMGAFCLLIVIGGDHAMGRLFPKAGGRHGILIVLALASMAAAMGAPASIALASSNHARAVAAAAAGTAALNAGLVWWLMNGWGLLGAACAVLAAESIGAAGRWITFLTHVPNAAHPARPRAEGIGEHEQ